MAPCSAGMPCSLASHQAWNPKSAPWWDDPLGVRVARRLCEYGAMPQLMDYRRVPRGKRKSISIPGSLR